MAKFQNLELDDKWVLADFFEGCQLYGIVTNFKNYKFCWYINRMLGFDFTLNTDIEIVSSKRERKYFFPVYHYTASDTFVSHFLYDNISDGEYLLTDYKHIDFLWLIKGDFVDETECRQIINVVRDTPEVQMISEIDIEKLSNKSYLLF